MRLYQYRNLVSDVLSIGGKREPARDGLPGTRELFYPKPLVFNLEDGFPLITMRRISFDICVKELLWILGGNTGVKKLVDQNVNIWNGNAYAFYKRQGGSVDYEDWLSMVKEGDPVDSLGKTYGYQIRNFAGIKDQLKDLIDGLRNKPFSRRHIITLWNPTEIGPDATAIPPCHLIIQCYISGNKLDLALVQRSADLMLGVPYDIAEYALLCYLLAGELGLYPGRLIWQGMCVHIYENHLKQAKALLDCFEKDSPRLWIKEKKPILEYTPDDFILTGYNPHPPVKFELNV